MKANDQTFTSFEIYYKYEKRTLAWFHVDLAYNPIFKTNGTEKSWIGTT